jgi:hypothetical protein
MNARIVNDIAALIREIDPDNMLIPSDLGTDLAPHLGRYGLDSAQRRRAARFIAQAIPDRDWVAVDLAELIVAEFNLRDAS